MPPAPLRPDDPARVARLHEYEILDTPAEPSFDALTRVAAIIAEVPIALVSLVGTDRQWFKSNYGLAAAETHRDSAFCSHVAHSRTTLVVPDASVDPRFCDNPLVTGEPGIRFYAGVPLRSPDGHVLGTLCAIDRCPRALTASQREALQLLADQVMQLLELRRTGRALRAERALVAERERELAERDLQMQNLFDAMVEGVVLQDQTGAILRHNRAAETILGLSEDQLTGRTSVDPRWRATRRDGTPFPGEEHPAMVTLRTGQPQDDVEMRVIQPDGAGRWLAINSRPLFVAAEPQPRMVVVTFRDVTEQRELAQRVAQHQRLVTTGTLAAGVGHEINNPLTYVLTNLGLAIEELYALTAGSPAQRQTELLALLEQAREGAERVKRIVRGLKSLAREDGDLLPTNVNAIVQNALQLANHELRTQAVVSLDLDNVALVQADDSRLSQVLINLLVNAAQAFARPDPSVNRITVRTRVDKDVVVEVIDNGPGIRPDVLPRIFDPFFTTKQVGVGTGLGLSISNNIVTGLGGELTCESEYGRGATFRIRLPIAAPAPEAEAEASRRAAHGRLLVIDDEPAIVRSMARLFQGECEVVTHTDPRAALAQLQAGDTFDVVFCDMTMPYLNGMEVYQATICAQPDMAERFVFISGAMSHADVRSFLARIPNERIEKPFSVQNLRGIVRRFIRSGG